MESGPHFATYRKIGTRIDCGPCRQESSKEMAVNYEIPFSVKHRINYPWPNHLWLQYFQH